MKSWSRWSAATVASSCPGEAGAANYNLACAYSQLGQFDKAGDPLTRAVNDYGVKYSVMMKDADLDPFMSVSSMTWRTGSRRISSDEQYRSSGWRQVTFQDLPTLRAERPDAGAGIGLLIILSRLASAIKGGPGAQSWGVLRNLNQRHRGGDPDFLPGQGLEGPEVQAEEVEEEEELGAPGRPGRW